MDTTNSIRSRYLLRPCTYVYITLMIFTFTTWLTGKSGMSGTGVALTVLGFALLKGFLIGDYYMGLRGVSSLWRWTIILWLLFTGSLITLAFVIAG